MAESKYPTHIRTAPLALWDLVKKIEGGTSAIPQGTEEETIEWCMARAAMLAYRAVKIIELRQVLYVNDPEMTNPTGILKSAIQAWESASSIDSGGPISALVRDYLSHVMPDPMGNSAAELSDFRDKVIGIVDQAQIEGRAVAPSENMIGPVPGIPEWIEWIGRDVVNEIITYERTQHPGYDGSFEAPESTPDATVVLDDTVTDPAWMDIDDDRHHDECESFLSWVFAVLATDPD